MRFCEKPFMYFALSLVVFLTASGLLSARASAFAVNGSVTNAALLKIDSMRANDDDVANKLSNDAKDQSLTVERLNSLIASNALGEYRNGDIDSIFYDRSNSMPDGFIYDKQTGSDASCKSTIKIQDEKFQLVNLRLDLGAKKCVDIFSTDWVLQLANTENMKVWFNWKNANTMVRVDGRDGDFTETDPTTPKVYYSTHTNNGCKDHVDLNDNVTLLSARPGYDRGAYYKGCDRPPSSNTYVGDTGNKTNPPNDVNGGGTTSEEVSCESTGASLSWIVCPVISFFGNATQAMYENIIAPWLKTDTFDFSSTSAVYRGWSNLRLYGNIILIIAMLVIVFGQTIGGGLVDAYTAKKVLPRILIAAVLINLSIYIVAAMVDITNILGSGFTTLFTEMVGGSGGNTLTFSGGTSGALIGSVVGTGALSIWAVVATSGAIIGALVQAVLLFVLLPAFLAILGVFVTLILRKGLILFLVLISPIAFALYCLPNTEQYFKKWWDLLLKALLVYPIISIVFGVSSVLAVTLNQSSNGDVNGLSAAVGQLASIIILVLPLFLIPFAFKLAGGAIGSLYGTIAGYNKRGSEAIKGNANDPNSLRNKSKRNVGEQMTRYQASIAHASRNNPNASIFRRIPGRIADSAMFGNVDQRLSNYTKAAAERRDTLVGYGPDDLVYAAGGYTLRAGQKDWRGNTVSKTTHYNSKGDEISKQMYDRGKALYGGSQHDVAQAIGYRLQKHQTDDDIAQARFAFAQNAQASNWNQGEMMGNWATVAYPHKGMTSSEWYSKPTRNADGSVSFEDISTSDSSYGGFISDLHKTRQSFQLSQLRDSDWRAMYDRQTKLQAKALTSEGLTDQEATQLAQTYEVFDAASQRLSTARGPGIEDSEDAISAAGGTAASQPIIKMAVTGRRDAGFSLGATSAGTRVINHGSGWTRAANVTGESDRGGSSSSGGVPGVSV